MTKICAESERSLDYYGLFKQIMKRAPVPMSPLESLASSAVRTAHKVILLLIPLPVSQNTHNSVTILRINVITITSSTVVRFASQCYVAC